jgi:hypothetical protein
MNRIKWIVVFIFPVVLFSACQTSKSIQQAMLDIQSEPDYELTTPVYSDSIYSTIYLNSIDYSAMLPYTTVRKTGVRVIPLLFFNLIQNRYEVSLGGNSLTQPYYDFLMDALLAECNRSSCFNLMESNNDVLPDSALTLEIKINNNKTTAKMIRNERLLFLPFIEDFSLDFSDWGINPPVSQLEISIRLVQQEICLWEKAYAVQQNLSSKKQKIEEPLTAFRVCSDLLTESLSYSTKSVVENICRDLHQLILLKQSHY